MQYTIKFLEQDNTSHSYDLIFFQKMSNFDMVFHENLSELIMMYIIWHICCYLTVITVSELISTKVLSLKSSISLKKRKSQIL